MLGKDEARKTGASDLALLAAARCVALARECEPGRKLPLSRLVPYELGDTLVRGIVVVAGLRDRG